MITVFKPKGYKITLDTSISDGTLSRRNYVNGKSYPWIWVRSIKDFLKAASREYNLESGKHIPVVLFDRGYPNTIEEDEEEPIFLYL